MFIMNFKELAIHPEFVDFHLRMLIKMKQSKFSGSIIGLDFKDNKLLSIKFYYVFFEKTDINEDFPIPELKDQYNKYIHYASSNLNSIFSPGCGLTFALKFDFNLEVSKGIFFRIDADNKDLINNVSTLYSEFNFLPEDFEKGLGIFLYARKGKLSENKYIYLKNTKKMEIWDDQYDIPFSKAETIEINNANSSEKKQKFLTIKTGKETTEPFLNKMPEIILKTIKDWDVNLWSKAINPNSEVYSVYLFNKPLFYDPENDLIQIFLNKITKK